MSQAPFFYLVFQKQEKSFHLWTFFQENENLFFNEVLCRWLIFCDLVSTRSQVVLKNVVPSQIDKVRFLKQV